jgi:hypothetical protein
VGLLLDIEVCHSQPNVAKRRGFPPPLTGGKLIQQLREISSRFARILTRRLLDKFGAANFFEELPHKKAAGS